MEEENHKLCPLQDTLGIIGTGRLPKLNCSKAPTLQVDKVPGEVPRPIIIHGIDYLCHGVAFVDDGQTFARGLVQKCRTTSATALHEVVLDSVTGKQPINDPFEVKYIAT